jgi:hypothetical protein
MDRRVSCERVQNLGHISSLGMPTNFDGQLYEEPQLAVGEKFSTE